MPANTNTEPRRPIRSTLLALLFLVASSTASFGDQHLADLSLEDLMDIQLDQLAITGIHHTHDEGEWMIGYNFMAMGMSGNLSGTNSLTTRDVLNQGFAVVPTRMYMEMHMLHVMYGVSDELSVMVMIPYLRKSMDHVRMDGAKFTTESRGIGDVSVGSLYSLYRDDTNRLLAQAELVLPTGSVDAIDSLPGMGLASSSFQRLPYPMQLGSGTVDFKVGGTYLGHSEGWTWGLHSAGKLRSGKNKHDYRLGNSYEVTSWGAAKLNDWSSSSLRLKWSQWYDIHGADPMLTPGMVPTADPTRRAGKRLDLLVGLNIFQEDGQLDGLRIGFEGGVPVYQKLDGPQLAAEWMAGLTIDWVL